MGFDAILLFVFFGLSSFSTLISIIILFAMIGAINRHQGSGAQVQKLRFSWFRVLKDYKSLYPNGRYTPALYAAIASAAVFGLSFAYVLFGILPRYSIPSR